MPRVVKNPQSNSLWCALRPFSLVVAIISAGLGIALAWQHGHAEPGLAVLVMLGAMLSQSGVNLINDLEDLSLGLVKQQTVRNCILRNAAVGVLCLAIAVGIGGYLAWLRGWPLLVIMLLSGVLALNYNLGPIHFKRRGLAVLQVFVLMGVVLVQGAYMAMGGGLSTQVIVLSLPISCLVSLLLLSNELRDWESDRRDHVRTLTVRVGYRRAVQLYWGLVVTAYVSSIGLLWGTSHTVIWLLAPLPLLLPIRQHLRAEHRPRLTPLTGRFFFAFGLAYLAALHW
ncbi:MAG TPA: prenyltransferase [Gammaproteobacteria bacterium]|nr:prenyltransferase [Gammaproteobacteria bacterium]